MTFPFEVGARYADSRGEYEVLAVFEQTMDVCYDDGSTASRFITSQSLAWSNVQYRRETAALAAPPAPRVSQTAERPARSAKRSAKPAAAPTFKREESSALVADLIRVIFASRPGYVTHHDLVTAITGDERGRKLIGQAQQGKERAPEEIAGNMVAWFSQEITSGASPFKDQFDRKRVKGAYAYSPL